MSIHIQRDINLISLGGRKVEYSVRFSPSARRARIKVMPSGVIVILPCDAAPGRAADFLRENDGWVLDQLDWVERMASCRIAPQALGECAILLRGVSTEVQVQRERTERRYGRVEQYDEGIIVRVPHGSTTEIMAKALQAWLRRQARSDIAKQMAQRGTQMRVTPGRLYIMDQRTRWGGCSRRKNLSFNWRLIMAPPAVLDYIVVHELAHLAEPYHSTQFWLIVRSYCPDFDKHRAWLRDNQSHLKLPHERA